MGTLQGEARQGTTRVRVSKGIPIVEDTFLYVVYADSATESYESVRATFGLPIAGITRRGFTTCRSLVGNRDSEQPTLWRFQAEFSSEVEENSQEPDSDPLEWVPVYETKFERLQELVTEDASGNAIVNSAGQPYETGMTRNRFIPVWTFAQFESSDVDDEEIIERNETVNDDTFRGRVAKSLLLTIEESVLGYYYGQRRRLTTYALRYNDRLWTEKRLDVGTVYKSGSDLLPYLDTEGNVILGALNGSGAKQTVGTDPATLEFDQFAELDFSSFLRTA